MANQPNPSPNIEQYGGWLVIGAALIGFVVALFNYFAPGTGIDHTPGAMLVAVSTLLILVASLLVYPDRIGINWVDNTLKVLIFLGIIGTAFAAYMLEATALLALIILALVGLLANLIGPSRAHAIPTERHGNTRRAAVSS